MDTFASVYGEFLQNDVEQALPMDTSDRHKKKVHDINSFSDYLDDVSIAMGEMGDDATEYAASHPPKKTRAPKLHNAWDKVKDAGKDVADWVADTAEQGWDDIKDGVDWIENIPKAIGDDINNAWDDINDAADDALKAVEDEANKIVDGLKDALPDGHRAKNALKVVGVGILLIGGAVVLWGSKEQNRQKVYKAAGRAARGAENVGKYAMLAL